MERNTNSERVHDLYSYLLKERIIILTGETNDAMLSSIYAQLLYLSGINGEPVQMCINSPGDSVSTGLTIYDIMKYICCDVGTIYMGACASMVTVLLNAGIQRKRSALSNSEVMVHQSMSGMQGQARDMEIATLHIQKLKERLYSVLGKNTRQSNETLRWDYDRDYYMDAEEALSYGLIDAAI